MNAAVKRNLELLHAVDSETAELLRGTAPADTVSVATSRSGAPVLVVRHGERERWLHSRVDPEREALRLAEMLSEQTGTVVVFGLGAGHHVRALLARAHVRTILICEPAADWAARALEIAGIGELLADPRVHLLTPCSPERLAWRVGTAHAPFLHRDCAFLPLRGRTDLDPGAFRELQQAAQRGVERALSDFATQRSFGLRWMHNIVVNATTLQQAYSGSFAPIAGPCVVAAAGPSLEKLFSTGVPEDATLVAADTALPMLLQRGVTPQFVLSIDSQLASYHHFLSGFPGQSVLVADLTASPTALRQAPAPALRVGGHPFSRYLSDHWFRTPELYTFAGSVTHAAIAFARSELHADVIGLAGADFGYPGAAAYARDSYIHRYVRLEESRLNPAEHALSAFVYDRARAFQDLGESDEIWYGSGLLDGYRHHLERLTNEIGVSIDHGVIPAEANTEGAVNGGERESLEPVQLPPIAHVFSEYLDALRGLPNAPSGPTIDLAHLPADEATIWHTILPVAAAESAVDQATGSPQTAPAEALDRARHRAASAIAAALRRITTEPR